MPDNLEYKQIVIYYFSGTGNSRNIAIWFANVAKVNETEVKVINISNMDRVNVNKAPSGALLVFISPVHGFNYPPVMLNFIARFPKSKNNKVLLMNTRAGLRIGKIITPGLSGLTFYLSSIIMKFKGYQLVGWIPVDMPSNWISVHPGVRRKTIEYLHVKNKGKVEQCAKKILSGKKYFKALKDIVQDLLIAPFALLYFIMGRFVFAKSYFASQDCTNCDLCKNKCPVKAITKVNNRFYWTFKCESCMKCMSNCPVKAIETCHGFLFGVTFLFYALMVSLVYSNLPNKIFAEQKILKFVLENALFIGFLALGYRIIHYLMRFKFVERIMVFTSLTKYKFWGRRYKAIKNRNET